MIGLHVCLRLIISLVLILVAANYWTVLLNQLQELQHGTTQNIFIFFCVHQKFCLGCEKFVLKIKQ